MPDNTEELLSPWWSVIAGSMRSNRAYCIGLFTYGGEVVYTNAAMNRLLGPDSTESMVNPAFADLVTAAQAASTQAASTQAQAQSREQIFKGFATFSRGGTDTSILTRVYTEGDQILLLGEVDVASLSNQYDSIVGLNRNISQLQRELLQHRRELQREVEERKNSQALVEALLEEKEAILREVHHRIKNNMNTVASLLRLQSATHDDPALTEILQDATNRIQSMMLLYDKLYRSSDLSAIALDEYLVPLLEQIIEIFPYGDRVTLQTEIAAIPCNPRFLSNLGIIINEMTTNVMKHAFPAIENDPPSSGGALIRLAAYVEKDTDKNADKDELIIDFSDNGRGLPPEISVESHQGFGMQLIAMLVQQLRGTLSVEHDGGTRFLIRCPMPRVPSPS